MDNLTHSLVGALIGQTGLKRRTGLAMPALVIGANLPDIDATCVAFGTVSLGMRRGLTHGPIAWVLLPLALAAILYAFDRWQARRGKRPDKRPPVHFGWLSLLALIGCLTHPLLDWFNSYGIRFLEPFSSRWFYGDILFIIDLWLWIGLSAALWLSLRRERRGGAHWRRPAFVALAAAILYAGLNAGISDRHRDETRLAAATPPATIIAGPVPLAFWQREMITGNGDGLWSVDGERLGEIALSRCALAAARAADPAIDAFLFWSRAPFAWRDGETWMLGDARFTDRRAGFSVALPPGTCG